MKRAWQSVFGSSTVVEPKVIETTVPASDVKGAAPTERPGKRQRGAQSTCVVTANGNGNRKLPAVVVGGASDEGSLCSAKSLKEFIRESLQSGHYSRYDLLVVRAMRGA